MCAIIAMFSTIVNRYFLRACFCKIDYITITVFNGVANFIYDVSSQRSSFYKTFPEPKIAQISLIRICMLFGIGGLNLFLPVSEVSPRQMIILTERNSRRRIRGVAI